MLNDWSLILSNAFGEVWLEVARIIPKTIAAVVIFAIGWLVGSVVGGVVTQLLRTLKLDAALKGLGLHEALARAGLKLDSGAFLGALVKWFFVTVFLVASVDILGLSEVNVFLRQVVLGYLPNVLVAALILILAALVADAVYHVVVRSAQAAGFASPYFAAGVSRWSIWIFALLIALSQLGIAPEFAQMLFAGVVFMLSLAGGLAFGLGGKDVAARYLDRLKRDISS